jgi:transcriptional regulator with XRE-family HTH domain
MDINSVIGDNVRGFRTKRKWSQARLAEQAGLHPNYIGYVERAERHITAYKLVDVAKALKVPIFLFFIEGAYRKSVEEIQAALKVK